MSPAAVVIDCIILTLIYISMFVYSVKGKNDI